MNTRKTKRSSPTPEEERPAPVSAVQGMSVTEVRRSTDLLRGKWTDQEAGHTLQLSDTLCELETKPISIQEFCVRLVLGHHTKRHASRGGRHVG